MTSKKKTQNTISKGWVEVPLEKLVEADWNYKLDDDTLQNKLIENIKRNGVIENILIRELDTGYYEVVNGNHRLKALKKMDWDKPIMTFNLGQITEKQAYRIAIETNETKFDVDDVELASLLKEIDAPIDDLLQTLPYDEKDLENFDKLLDFDVSEFDEFDHTEHEPEQFRGEEKSNTDLVLDFLSEMFVVPPMNILNRETRHWKDRLDYWKTKGLLSHVKLNEEYSIPQIKDFLQYDSEMKQDPFNSEDPVLIEVILSWFSEKGYKILDLFSGNEIAGLVAGDLEMNYTGYETDSKIVKNNKKELKTTPMDIALKPHWINDDSENVSLKSKYDLIMARVPFIPIEPLSGVIKKENSEVEYKKKLNKIFKNAVKVLKDHRFFVVVVKDYFTHNECYSTSSIISEILQTSGLIKASEIIVNETLTNLDNGIPLNRYRYVQSPAKILVFRKKDIVRTALVS